VTSGGGVKNCKSVNKGSQIQLGMTYGVTAYNAFHGKAPFEKKLTNIRGLGIVMMAYWHAVVRDDSDIKSPADLNKKRIVVGAPGLFSRVCTETVMKAYGLDFDTLRAGGGTISNVSWTDAVEMMKDNNVDFIGYLTGLPTHTVISLTTAVDIRLLEIDKKHQEIILGQEPGYLIKPIPASTYKGVNRDTLTLATDTQFICHKDLPDDLVYEITKMIFEDLPQDKAAYKQFGNIDIKRGFADIKIPVHPGAKKYFDEH
jgi:TRAP transporter TAXI family solute receptor